MTLAKPNLLLAVAAAVTVVVELATRSQARYGPECLVAVAALAVAWRRRAELRPGVLVAIAVLLPAAIALVHLGRGVPGDIDVESIFPAQGRQLLRGSYPHSEYPPGAVLLFAGEEWLRSARTVNPFVMAAAEGVIVWAIAAVRTAEARWLAALVAVWPVNAFFSEFKFDALPTALLVAGVVLATRQRWFPAGLLLGAGAAVKWTPLIAVVVLVAWLLAMRRYRAAGRLSLGSGLSFAAIVLPFLAWSPDAVWAAVSRQAPRGITPEALWYLPLRALGRASELGAVYDGAAVPNWANTMAVGAQVAVLLALVAGVAVVRPSLERTAAVALTASALFLLLNKVFSAQYAVTVIAAICLAAALAGRALLAGSLLALFTAANVLVYPIGRFWLGASAVAFAAALLAAAILVRAALGRGSTSTAGGYPAEP